MRGNTSGGVQVWESCSLAWVCVFCRFYFPAGRKNERETFLGLWKKVYVMHILFFLSVFCVRGLVSLFFPLSWGVQDTKGKRTAWTRSISKLKFIRANVKEHRRRGNMCVFGPWPSLALSLLLIQQGHKTQLQLSLCKFLSSSLAPEGKVPKFISTLSIPPPVHRVWGEEGDYFYKCKIVNYVQSS